MLISGSIIVPPPVSAFAPSFAPASLSSPAPCSTPTLCSSPTPCSSSAPCSSPAPRHALQKPLIALTPYHNLSTDEPYMRPAYLEAIIHADGIPVILPLTSDESVLQQLVSVFDAFLFTGGPDLHPFYFHEETHACCGNISPKRDAMELLLLKLAMKAQKPILGICRGIQLLNICLGGDIYQDIPSQLPVTPNAPSASVSFPIAHAQPFAYDIPSHTVTVSPRTLLADLSASDTSAAHSLLKVNSMHHQAVRRLAPGLIASGYACDGIIEAIEKPDYPTFFLGVQWHPEYLWKQDETASRIFSRFVCAALDSRRPSAAADPSHPSNKNGPEEP